MKKTCSRCKATKPTKDFCKCARMSDGLQSACKTCMNDSYNRSRKKDQLRYQKVQKEREARNAERLNEWKQQQRCCSCAEGDPSCLDLHHLDPNKKDVTISNVKGSWSWERLQTELDKCVVICANCHRKVHAGKINLLTNYHK